MNKPGRRLIVGLIAKGLAYGEGVLLLLFLGPVIVIISIVEMLSGAFTGSLPVSRKKYNRDMLKSFQGGYAMGLRHMASPPHLRLWQDVAEIIKRSE